MSRNLSSAPPPTLTEVPLWKYYIANIKFSPIKSYVPIFIETANITRYSTTDELRRKTVYHPHKE